MGMGCGMESNKCINMDCNPRMGVGGILTYC